MFDIDPVILNKGNSRFQTLLPINVISSSALDFISRYCSVLNMKMDDIETCKKLAKLLEDCLSLKRPTHLYLVYALLLFKDHAPAHWCGSIMSTQQAKKLFTIEEAGPTSSQVFGGIFMALLYILEYPNRGLCTPEDMTREEREKFFKKAKIFFGKIYNDIVDFKPESNQFVDLLI